VMVHLGGELPHRGTVYAPYPTRQMTLIGEAGLSGDLRKAQATLAEELAGAFEPRPHHVAMGRDANRARECAAEVERAEAGYARRVRRPLSASILFTARA
jgi:hypothetical protein